MTATPDDPFAVETVIFFLRREAVLNDSVVEAAVMRAMGAFADVEDAFFGGSGGVKYRCWQCGALRGRVGEARFRYDRVEALAPPDDPELERLWVGHAAWRYVDAQGPAGAAREAAFRMAAEVADDECLLAWHWQPGTSGPQRSRCIVPTPAARTALARGTWPAAG